MLEYNALVDGKEKDFRERMEVARWEKYIDARLNGFLKQKPTSPEDLVKFPWEQKAPEKVEVSTFTDEDAEKLTNIFKQANF